jgi:hypothetical protein
MLQAFFGDQDPTLNLPSAKHLGSCQALRSDKCQAPPSTEEGVESRSTEHSLKIDELTHLLADVTLLWWLAVAQLLDLDIRDAHEDATDRSSGAELETNAMSANLL